MNPLPMALASAVLLAGLPTEGLAADGAKVFALQCKSCHQAKSTLMGPSLKGVAGGKIAAVKDFKYSPALKAKLGLWTDAQLDLFLTTPAKFAPGNRMPTGVASAADRLAVIGYMKTLK